MKIKSIKVIDGKNKWSESKDKLIHMVLDLGEFEEKPSNKIEGFYERIKEHLPSLQSHRCSEGKAGGFFKRIKEGTWMGHIIEHVALELQTLAGMDTGWGRTRGVKGQKGVYNVVFNYVDKDKGRLAAREAFNVVNDIIDNKNPQIDNIVKKLKPKLQESIRKVLKEYDSDKMIELIENYLNFMYPIFNNKDVYTEEYSDSRGYPVISFFDNENGIYLGKYYYGDKSLELNRAIFNELEGLFNDDMEYVIDWFNNEFDLNAEYVTYKINTNIQENVRKELLQESLRQTLMDEIERSGIKDTANLMTVHVGELLHMVGIKGTQEDMIFLAKVIMENEVKELLDYCSYDIVPTLHSFKLYVFIPKPLPEEEGVWSRDQRVREEAKELISQLLWQLSGGLIKGHSIEVSNTGNC